jgi:hypothetical protein
VPINSADAGSGVGVRLEISINVEIVSQNGADVGSGVKVRFEISIGVRIMSENSADTGSGVGVRLEIKLEACSSQALLASSLSVLPMFTCQTQIGSIKMEVANRQQHTKTNGVCCMGSDCQRCLHLTQINLG